MLGYTKLTVKLARTTPSPQRTVFDISLHITSCICSNLPAANYSVQAIFAQSGASRSSIAWLFSLNQALHPTGRKEVRKSQEAKEISKAHETGDSQSPEWNGTSGKQLLVRGGSSGSSSLQDGQGTPGE